MRARIVGNDRVVSDRFDLFPQKVSDQLHPLFGQIFAENASNIVLPENMLDRLSYLDAILSKIGVVYEEIPISDKMQEIFYRL